VAAELAGFRAAAARGRMLSKEAHGHHTGPDQEEAGKVRP
jgi:hypothetical protein